MADDRSYRIWIRYDAEADEFVGQVPELDVSAVGASRAEAVEGVEAAIDDRLRAAADGEPLPPPADLREVDGQLELEISQGLHRYLVFFAEQSGISVESLATELIAKGVGMLEGLSAAPRAETRPEPEGDDDRGRGRRRRKREGYRPELDDKDNFREYLRRMEKGGGGQGRR